MSDTTDTLDLSHWVFDRFEAAGYPRETLFDPGQVLPEDFEKHDLWRVLVWRTHGIEMFDVDETSISHADWAPGDGHVVEYGTSRPHQQPIGFEDDTGLLNKPERMPTLTQFKADSDPSITFLWPADAERSFPDYSEEEAVEAIGYWDSEGWMPEGTVDAIAYAFDLAGDALGGSIFRGDPDVDGERIARAPHVPAHVASAVLGESKSADSDISGHKKMRRQKFYRNLDALEEHYGIDTE